MIAASLPTSLKQPLSCSTHLANVVNERLLQAKLSSRALEFCLFLHRQTFGNAGWHRKQGRVEWCCRFELSTWARTLGCDKSNLRRLRLGLEAAHIIVFESDEDGPGQGWIAWNLKFAEWQPYDGRRRRTSGQGRGREQACVVMLHEQPPPQEADQQAPLDRWYGQSSLKAGSHQGSVVNLPRQTPSVQQAGVVNSSHQNGTKRPRPLAQNAIQLTTPASSEVALEEASAAQVRKGLRNKKTPTPHVVVEVQSTSPKASEVEELLEAEAEGLLRLPSITLPQEAGEADAASIRESPKLAFSWPVREAHERTDLDFFQRVLREHDSQRVALLTRLAHERISVPLASPSYARIGALAKQCGAGLLVKHILLAAAQHIDGDALDYLTKLVINAQRKDYHHDTRPATSRPTDQASSSRPYSSEEARQLVWHT
jgi:hypothetical protein